MVHIIKQKKNIFAVYILLKLEVKMRYLMLNLSLVFFMFILSNNACNMQKVSVNMSDIKNQKNGSLYKGSKFKDFLLKFKKLNKIYLKIRLKTIFQFIQVIIYVQRDNTSSLLLMVVWHQMKDRLFIKNLFRQSKIKMQSATIQC